MNDGQFSIDATGTGHVKPIRFKFEGESFTQEQADELRIGLARLLRAESNLGTSIADFLRRVADRIAK